MNTASWRVVVTHPARQHSYETVLAAQDADMLQQFVTSYYWRHDTALSSGALRVLPTSLRRRLRHTLRKRWHPELDSSRVSIVPFFDIPARLVAALERALPAFRWIHANTRAERQFDHYVGRWLLRQPVPDIVHAFEGSALHTHRAARRQGAATVLDVPSAHEYVLRSIREEGGWLDERWEAAVDIYNRAERAGADWLLVGSDQVRHCLIEHGVPDAKIITIPYGVDPLRFTLKEPAWQRSAGSAGPFRVLFVGNIAPFKGVRYLLDAWTSLAIPNAQLILVGGGEASRPPLVACWTESCHWTGNIPWHRVHLFFDSADVFVFPSLAEGSALVTYEAMAAGLPMVTTPNAGSVARDGVDCLLVPPRDPGALADRLQWLYEHPRERAQMGARARQRILERYTWHHYRARLACAYRAICAGLSVPTALAELEAEWKPATL